MSAVISSPDGLALPRKLSKTLNHKEARYITARLRGLSSMESCRQAGISAWASRTIEHDPAIEQALEECTALLVESALVVGLADAAELHEQLSDEVRGDLSDLYTETHELKPIAEWPLWARMGGVEVLDEPNMVPSKDEGGASWDQVGRRIKVKSVNRAKAREQLGKLKAVNAFVEVKQDTNVNVVVVTAEKARAVAGAKKRLARVVDVLPVDASEPSE